MHKFCVSLLIPRDHLWTKSKRAITMNAVCVSYVQFKAQQIEQELSELYAHAEENYSARKETYVGIELHWESLVPILEKGRFYVQIWGTVRCESDQVTTVRRRDRIAARTSATWVSDVDRHQQRLSLASKYLASNCLSVK